MSSVLRIETLFTSQVIGLFELHILFSIYPLFIQVLLVKPVCVVQEDSGSMLTRIRVERDLV